MLRFDVALPHLWIHLAELQFERNMSLKKNEHREEMEAGREEERRRNRTGE